MKYVVLFLFVSMISSIICLQAIDIDLGEIYNILDQGYETCYIKKANLTGNIKAIDSTYIYIEPYYSYKKSDSKEEDIISSGVYVRISKASTDSICVSSLDTINKNMIQILTGYINIDYNKANADNDFIEWISYDYYSKFLCILKLSYQINSIGGCEPSLDIINLSLNPIKYITINMRPYNEVGDAVRCTISGLSNQGLKATGFINYKELREYAWNPIWYNATINNVKVQSVTITYKDNKVITLLSSDRRLHIIYLSEPPVSEMLDGINSGFINLYTLNEKDIQDKSSNDGEQPLEVGKPFTKVSAGILSRFSGPAVAKVSEGNISAAPAEIRPELQRIEQRVARYKPQIKDLFNRLNQVKSMYGSLRFTIYIDSNGSVAGITITPMSGEFYPEFLSQIEQIVRAWKFDNKNMVPYEFLMTFNEDYSNLTTSQKAIVLSNVEEDCQSVPDTSSVSLSKLKNTLRGNGDGGYSYELDDGDGSITILSRVLPTSVITDYGKVTLQFKIKADGSVLGESIIPVLVDDAIYTKDAVNALQQWNFDVKHFNANLIYKISFIFQPK